MEPHQSDPALDFSSEQNSTPSLSSGPDAVDSDEPDRLLDIPPGPLSMSFEEQLNLFELLEGVPKPKPSPAFDESVNGFPGDIQPLKDGVYEMLEVMSLLNGVGIPCCAVAEPALCYYGAERCIDVRSSVLYF